MFRPRNFHRRGRGTAQGFALGLLLMQVMRVGVDNIPPVTLAGIIGQVVIFLKVLKLPWPSISSVCVSASNVWYKREWNRIFLAPFFHADEWHLYYNMASFIWKGRNLEPRFGSSYFAYLIAVFAVLVNVVMIGLAIALEQVTGDASYLWQCGVGFSGVLFALKVVATHISPAGTQMLLGFIPVPSKYACWAELILIHILVPRSSFIGHLAGILVGLAYTKGPLRDVMDLIFNVVGSTRQHGTRGGGWQHPQHQGHYTRQQRARQSHYGGGTVGGDRSRREAGQSEREGGDVSGYTAGMSEEEQIQAATRNSLHDVTEQQQQVQQAVQNSMQGQGSVSPSAPPMEATSSSAAPSSLVSDTPPSYNSLYPNLPTDNGVASAASPTLPPRSREEDAQQEELRRRRLARFSANN